MKTTNIKTNKMELTMKNQSSLKNGNKLRERKLRYQLSLLIIFFTSLSINYTLGQNAQSLNTNSFISETAKNSVSVEKNSGIKKEYAVATTKCDKEVCSKLLDNTTFISNVIRNTNFIDIKKRARKELKETWKCKREGNIRNYACLVDIKVHKFNTRKAAEDYVEDYKDIVRKGIGSRDIIRISL